MLARIAEPFRLSISPMNTQAAKTFISETDQRIDAQSGH